MCIFSNPEISQHMLKKILLAVVPVVLLLVFLIVVYDEPLVIERVDQDEYTLSLYSDQEYGGNSVCKFSDDKQVGRLKYTYRLGDKLKFPFAGLMLFEKDSSFIDVSKYDHCRIVVKAEKGRHIPFYLFTHIDGFSDWPNIFSFYHLYYLLDLDEGWNEVDLDFKNGTPPDWWYNFHGNQSGDLPDPDFSQVVCLNFANCNILSVDDPDTVYVSQIEFYSDLTWFYVMSFVLLAVYYSSWTVLVVLRKKKSKASEIEAKPITPVFTYEKVDVESKADKDKLAVIDYINSNFSKAELSIFDVQKATGVSDRTISLLLKQESGLGFKQFLNKLRITEAKRLLKETDLQISEIAFKIGYGNVSHFNRVFKQETEDSPSNYRKSNSG